MKTTKDYYQKIITLDKKMGCACSKSDEPKIRIYDCTPPDDDFEYLRPNGTITFSIDRKYNIPLLDITLDGWCENSVRLWPKHSDQREHFFIA